MSKKKKKRNRKTPQERTLNRMLECNPACGDIGTYEPIEFGDMYSLVDYYEENLPGLQFVEQQFVNYIFADGMSAGGVQEDSVLNDFRFRMNDQNTTNNAVLRDAVRYAHCRHGECGVRWKDGNVYLYKSGTYAPLTLMSDGIEEVVAYIATTDGEYINEREVSMENLRPVGDTLEEIEAYFAERNMVVFDKSEFVNLRNDTSLLNGESPLEKDRLRLHLLVSVYERLNYDVNYDGPGRLLFPVKSGYVEGGENEVSTTEILKSTGNKANAKNSALQEIERITEDIKDSSSDSAIAISDGFKDPIHLPRVTKATEFLEWIEKEGEILADVIGLPPSLLEEGQLSGNVSMTRIVDNAMLNSIVPWREHYASQLSQMIASHLGLSKIFFDQYKLQSEQSETAKWVQVADAMSKINAIEDVPETKQVLKTFAEMLLYDTHDSLGDVIELADVQGHIDEEEETKGTKEKKSWLQTRFWNS